MFLRDLANVFVLFVWLKMIKNNFNVTCTKKVLLIEDRIFKNVRYSPLSGSGNLIWSRHRFANQLTQIASCEITH